MTDVGTTMRKSFQNWKLIQSASVKKLEMRQRRRRPTLLYQLFIYLFLSLSVTLSLSLFLSLFSSFQYSWQNIRNIKLADVWIRSVDHSSNWATTSLLSLSNYFSFYLSLSVHSISLSMFVSFSLTNSLTQEMTMFMSYLYLQFATYLSTYRHYRTILSFYLSF